MAAKPVIAICLLSVVSAQLGIFPGKRLIEKIVVVNFSYMMRLIKRKCQM